MFSSLQPSQKLLCLFGTFFTSSALISYFPSRLPTPIPSLYLISHSLPELSLNDTSSRSLSLTPTQIISHVWLYTSSIIRHLIEWCVYVFPARPSALKAKILLFSHNTVLSTYSTPSEHKRPLVEICGMTSSNVICYLSESHIHSLISCAVNNSLTHNSHSQTSAQRMMK